MKGKIPHIVQYQGSKRLLAPQILNYIPRRFNRFVEPFAGMAAMSIAVAYYQKADTFLLNDLNKPLAEILSMAINNPSQLIMEYANIWEGQFESSNGSTEHYYRIREEFNAGAQSAANMLYLLARCVKGSVRYGSNGLFNQSPDKRRNGTKPKTLASNIHAISGLLKGRTEIKALDYKKVLELVQPGDLVYMDPPYQGVCSTRDSRYFSGIDYDSFVDEIDKLNKRGIDFMISYDGSCGERQYGNELPEFLGLKKVLLNAGFSSQSILLGRKEVTCEALYISSSLYEEAQRTTLQTTLFADCV